MLLTSSEQGATDYLHAELSDTTEILAGAAGTLDLGQPVALILGHVADYDEARAIVGRLLDPLASGSHLLICDGTDTDEALNAAQQQHNDRGAVLYHLRSPEQIAGFFSGLELVEPGVAPCLDWHPEPIEVGEPMKVNAYGGIGRKP